MLHMGLNKEPDNLLDGASPCLRDEAAIGSGTVIGGHDRWRATECHAAFFVAVRKAKAMTTNPDVLTVQSTVAGRRPAQYRAPRPYLVPVAERVISRPACHVDHGIFSASRSPNV